MTGRRDGSRKEESSYETDDGWCCDQPRAGIWRFGPARILPGQDNSASESDRAGIGLSVSDCIQSGEHEEAERRPCVGRLR